MKNKKQGEQEAAAILRSIGVQLDENYYDDNSEKVFPTIYVCAWDFDKQEYNTINPEMIKFYKEKEVLNWHWYNYIEENLEYFANIDNG